MGCCCWFGGLNLTECGKSSAHCARKPSAADRPACPNSPAESASRMSEQVCKKKGLVSVGMESESI